jgi:RNA polymerase sigma-70 factor (ECF subfamily)
MSIIEPGGVRYTVSFEAAAWFPTLRLTRRKNCETGPGPTAPGLAEELRDNSLLTRVAEGDQDAFASLYTRYTRLVYSIATRILGDATEAEDLVQDLFLFIQRKCGVFDSSKSSARSWIVQMTYQRAIERRRYLATRQFYARAEFQVKVDHLVGRPTLEDDYSPEAVFGRNGLRRALEALSKDQRETLRLYFFEGFTLAEVSTKLGQPLGNVRHHYYRALEKLRKQMFAGKLQTS